MQFVFHTPLSPASPIGASSIGFGLNERFGIIKINFASALGFHYICPIFPKGVHLLLFKTCIMSEEIVPEVIASDVESVKPELEETVPEVAEAVQDETSQEEAVLEDKEEAQGEETSAQEVETPDYQGMTLSEIVAALQEITSSEARMTLYKNVEAIKSAFYKKLAKEKEAAILKAEQIAAEAEAGNPFVAIEEGFKAAYAAYKKERAEYNEKMEQERRHNLELKKQVIEDLKTLIEKQEDVNTTFPAFREIQNRWREIGPVPASEFRNLNETYILYVEQFYDLVKLNRESRDEDFRRNLEAKQQFCEKAEALAEESDIVEAFKELQKFHTQWKDCGPVAKELRDEIWDRFKAATAVINRRYQAHYEELKSKQEEALAAKTALCVKAEEIAAMDVTASNDWNRLTKDVENIQQEWRTIGFAGSKNNQKIYDRFKAACDAFFVKKRTFYTDYKDSLKANLQKKIALCEAAEALKTSTEWKKTAQELQELQKAWKEIGAVPYRNSDEVWKRFRAACDEFFAERDKNAKPENDFYRNLKAKRALIKEISEYRRTDAAADAAALKDFNEKWSAIGFVPFKEKDRVNQEYREALKEKFGVDGRSEGRQGRKAPRSEKEILIDKFNRLQQDIATYENNIGFFTAGRNSNSMIESMQKRIDEAKAELSALAEKIRKTEE